MNKILAFGLTCLIAVNVWAAPGSPTLWDRAVYGDKPGLTQVDFQGYNGAITTTAEALWPESAAYTVLAAAMTSPYCASTSTDDDGAPVGTGALTIRVKGLKTTFAAFSEDLILNGQTSVALTTTLVLVINSVEVLTAGTGGVNAGVVACGTGNNTGGDPAVVHAYVATGANRSMQSWYGVPAGYTLICKNWTLQSYGVTAGQTVQFILNRYVNLGILKTEYLGFLSQAGSSAITIPNVIKFAEKTIFKVDALSAASTGPASVRADCLLLSDSWVDTAQDLF